MLDQKIEAVFENGVFRPLQPVQLPEHQRVTLLLPTEEETFQDSVGYEPLAFHECTTIRVRFKRVGDFGPLPYPAGPVCAQTRGGSRFALAFTTTVSGTLLTVVRPLFYPRRATRGNSCVQLVNRSCSY